MLTQLVGVPPIKSMEVVVSDIGKPAVEVILPKQVPLALEFVQVIGQFLALHLKLQ